MRFPGIIVGNTLTLHKTVSESDTSGLVGRGEHVRTIVKRREPSAQPYFGARPRLGRFRQHLLQDNSGDRRQDHRAQLEPFKRLKRNAADTDDQYNARDDQVTRLE